MTLENMRYLLILNNKELLERMDEINMSISLIIEANNDMIYELNQLIVTDKDVEDAIAETLKMLEEEETNNDT